MATPLYVNRIETCAARHASVVTVWPPSPEGVVSGFMPLIELPLSGLAQLEVSREVSDGLSLFTSKLTAVMACPVDEPVEPQVLRLTLTDGSQLYLGTSARPFPTVSLSTSRPSKASEQSAQTLTAEWVAPMPPYRAETL